MNIFEYQELAMRTAKALPRDKAILHAVTGISDEAGEFSSAIKKAEVYGQQLNFVNIAEELGDLLWFVAYSAQTFGMSLETIARLNIEKLATRYPEGYSDYHAAARLDKEGENGN